jgi:DUF1680 family protein
MRTLLRQAGLPLFALCLVAVPAAADAPKPGPAALTAVPFRDVHIKDDFWSPRLRRNRTVTIEANLRQCERTGCIENFAVAGKVRPGKHRGLLFNDSDLYKVIEGIAYSLAAHPDPDLEKRTDAIIDLIAAAQQPDGYLNTYFTIVELKNRWKNIQHGHELYCAGHLMEAAVAYQQATGKRKLLGVARKLADHIISVFGPGKKVDTSGHEEIELALVKLFRATGEARYLKQAQFFLDVRGQRDQRRLFGEYAQDHKPVREQREVTGHAVRAMYLYCGMADVAAATGDRKLTLALESIWRDVVERKMYVTGGIGPSASNEGFTVPYDLPNDSAYAETCAAVGMALWNQRMFLMAGDGKYADVLERVVYNGLLSGVSLGGDRFFYVNPLGSRGKHHRQDWFECSCCPGNVVRYLAGLGDRVYATRGNDVWTVLYLCNMADVRLTGGKVRLTQETEYPWDGEVQIKVEPEKSFAFTLHLRIPAWCRADPVIEVNGARVGPVQRAGAPAVEVEWVLRAMPPEQAKGFVLNYLEEPLKHTDGIKAVRSSAADGVWTVRALLADRADPDAVSREVAALAKKATAFLPPGAKPAVVRTPLRVRDGYVALSRTWKAGDVVRLVLPMPVMRVYADPRVKADEGRVALQRGPIVYCLEGVDNDNRPRTFVLPRKAELTAGFEKHLLGGVVTVRGEALAVSLGGKNRVQILRRPVKFKAVPYATWDNRAAGEMVVWLPERRELAELPGADGVLSNGVRIRASHCNPSDSLAALNDGVLPKSSKDHGLPRMTWWDHRGGVEWVSYQFAEPRRLSSSSVYWFDDTGIGRCRVPASWRLLWRDGKDWKEVKLTGGARYGTATDRFNEVTFEPVTTGELKLEVRLQPEFSGGILEWTVAGR